VEADLVRRAQHGDQRAFDTLATGLVTRFHAVAYRVLGDADLAQDAAQQALISVWRDLPQLRDPSRFEGWAYRVLIRACYKEAGKRRGWRLRRRDPTDVEVTSPDPTNAVVERDRLQRGFARLSVEHRAVVVLHHYLGQTQGQVADTLDIPVETVRSRLRHAMRGLRAAIEADERTVPRRSATTEASR
jgi:RNA polymerase sigma-70 factor (ECF subfamily)